MIHWRDEALILSFSRHGESAALIEIISAKHGRHKGIVRGGGSRKQAPTLQPGLIATVEYSARLEEHLGSFRIEPAHSYVSLLMSNPKRLAGFQAMASLIRFSMEERDPHPALYRATQAWLENEDFARAYLDWELILLREAGFELELQSCAVTGQKTDLAYISPKTGRAVSKEAAGEWADRLLPYSSAFQEEEVAQSEVLTALRVTEYFLINWLAQMNGKAELPAARSRFIKILQTKTNNEEI